MGRKTCSSLMLAWSYIIGSVFFLGGSVLFHPFFSTNNLLYKIGVAQFIAGSALFLIPAVYEWTVNYAALLAYETTPKPPFPSSPPPPREMSDDDGSASPRELASLLKEHAGLHENYHLEKHAVAMTRSSVSVLNGVLFVVGSLAYWPDFGRSGIVTGNWLFRMGSSFTLISCCWAFARCFKPSPNTKKTTRLLQLFYMQYIIGAIGFLTGGFFFLFGWVEVGAIIWACGSVFFISGSLMLLVM
eukprot:TRINITY_DN8544_c0_g1_i1.p1 TRINITY_DN8544_c0_g1~~TRINITY_DN8544_c0_g1_i1.p1  ORF type:complete len:244 (+),score=30.70 TRINITY_DN8544_c0_g1_i1:71-802(+)